MSSCWLGGHDPNIKGLGNSRADLEELGLVFESLGLLSTTRSMDEGNGACYYLVAGRFSSQVSFRSAAQWTQWLCTIRGFTHLYCEPLLKLPCRWASEVETHVSS